MDDKIKERRKKLRKKSYVGYGNFSELPKWDFSKECISELGGFVMPNISLTKHKVIGSTKMRIIYEEIE